MSQFQNTKMNYEMLVYTILKELNIKSIFVAVCVI